MRIDNVQYTVLLYRRCACVGVCILVARLVTEYGAQAAGQHEHSGKLKDDEIETQQTRVTPREVRALYRAD